MTKTMLKNKNKLREEIMGGLVIGLVYGLVYGLTITFITNLIGLIILNPEASLFNLLISGLTVLFIEIIGWIIVKKLKQQEEKQ